MAHVKKPIEKTVVKYEDVRVSDFSGQPIPRLHWAAVTCISCHTFDHGNFHGNKTKVFELDLSPEEMRDFLVQLEKLIASMKSKYRHRVNGAEL